MINWMMLYFVICLLWSFFWLLLVACWDLHPRFIPKIQVGFLDFFFRMFWYSRIMAGKFFPLAKLEVAPLGCHKIASNNSKSNVHDVKKFDMELVSQFISLSTRPNRPFYFLAAFVFPLLPLDLTGNKSKSWNRIYACFTYIFNREKIIIRSEQIARKYAVKLAHDLQLSQQQQLKVTDEKFRYMICAIMWNLVFGSEPSESDLKTITELTQSISTSFSDNSDPDWSKRIDLCLSFMEQIRCHPEILILQRDFNLTAQEMCTVVAMELFITPALEISEVMSNLMLELASDNTELVRIISCNLNVMRYAIMATAHHYPVLQAIFREVRHVDNQNLTPCSNWFRDAHVVEIQTSDIAESIKHESISDNISRYILHRENGESCISEVQTCMAFGKGQRLCKGKELAIKIITSVLMTLYSELDHWPSVEISAGRKHAAFKSFDHRLYHWYRRCMIADVFYYVDKLFRRSNLERFQCQL